MTVLDYEFQFKDTGVVLNTDAVADAPFVDITKVSGLDNSPYRITERDREGQDGGFVDAEFEKLRTIVLEGTVYSPQDQIAGYLDTIKANYAPVTSSQPLYLKAPNTSDRVVFCKSYGARYDWDTAMRIGTTPVQFTLVAEDPTIYDAVPTTISVGLPVEGAGRAYDKAYDYGYGAESTGGTIAFTNGGNKPATATITILGPIINPTVAHSVSGKQLRFNIELADGQALVIELRDRTVLLNGTANRRSSLINTSQWFMIEPGVNSLHLLGTDNSWSAGSDYDCNHKRSI